jgi:spore coat polysaccharide biosynthesis protein SpsF (cytidylyltransferase family)
MPVHEKTIETLIEAVRKVSSSLDLDEVLDTIAAAPSGDTWVDLVNGEGFLKIRGVNQHVVYRLADYVPESRCYIGEWPD